MSRYRRVIAITVCPLIFILNKKNEKIKIITLTSFRNVVIIVNDGEYGKSL
jgi:hypothetical protein